MKRILQKSKTCWKNFFNWEICVTRTKTCELQKKLPVNPKQKVMPLRKGEINLWHHFSRYRSWSIVLFSQPVFTEKRKTCHILAQKTVSTILQDLCLNAKKFSLDEFFYLIGCSMKSKQKPIRKQTLQYFHFDISFASAQGFFIGFVFSSLCGHMLIRLWRMSKNRKIRKDDKKISILHVFSIFPKPATHRNKNTCQFSQFPFSLLYFEYKQRFSAHKNFQLFVDLKNVCSSSQGELWTNKVILSPADKDFSGKLSFSCFNSALIGFWMFFDLNFKIAFGKLLYLVFLLQKQVYNEEKQRKFSWKLLQFS